MGTVVDYEKVKAKLEAGQYRQMESMLRQLLEGGDTNPRTRELLVEALRRQDRGAEALALCDELIADFPGRASAWREAGRTCNNLGQLVRARGMLEKARELAGGEAELEAGIELDLGHVCRRLGDTVGARRAVEHAVVLRPGWPTANFRLGMIELDERNFSAAEQAIAKSLVGDEENVAAWTALGVARHRGGKNQAASEAYRRALALNPDSPEAIANLAISLHDDGNLQEAIAGYQNALQKAPNDPRTATHLADALLEAGDCQRALSVAEELLHKFPGHAGGLASRTIALQRLGRESDYAKLVDLDKLVVAIDIDVPEGFESLDAFNSALAEHVLNHQSLHYEPAGHATRRGHHTADLLRYEKGPVAALEQAVARGAEAYKQRLASLRRHPTLAAAPAAWRLSLWSVVMGSAGHQLPHVHPSAWLSGVYYAQLPEIVAADDSEQAGWIEFGSPPEKLAGEMEFPSRRLAPATGRMFLFPAFFYHRTVPFISDEARISLAFDLAPVAAAGATMGRT